MELSFLDHINHPAVIAAAFIFFAIGSLWFSALFGTMWREELKKEHTTIKEPTKQAIMAKMVQTLVANFIASYAMACLVIMTGSVTIESGLFLGTLAAIGFGATAIASVFIWESRSLKLFLIDVGYPVVGIIITAVLLSVWQ